MAGYSNNSPTEVYNNGTLFRYNEEEWKFITDNQNNSSTNRAPSMMNIYGSSNQSIPANADKPFKVVVPVVDNGKIVGYNWKVPIVGTTGPSDPNNPNRAAISEETTKKLIDMANKGEIDKREAMFAIRARVGMENADVPAYKAGSKNEDLYREDARHPSDNSAGYTQYGKDGKIPDVTKKNSTNFDRLKDQIYNQDNARKLLERTNEFSRELNRELNPPNKNGSIRETYDKNGFPRYIKRPEFGNTGIDNWKLFTPEVDDILQKIPEESRPYVMADLNHLVSTNATRNQNPNDNTSRSSGPKLDVFDFASTHENEYKTPSDIRYKGLKAGRGAMYGSTIGAFFIIGLLKYYGKLDSHTAHVILNYIEIASTGFKTTKNMARAGSHYGSLWDQLSPIYSTIAPSAWYFIGHWLGARMVQAAFPEIISLFGGPIVTMGVIGLEVGYEAWQKKQKESKEEQRIEELGKIAEKKGVMKQVFIDSDGKIEIPIIDQKEYPDTIEYDNLPADDPRRTRPRGRIQKARIPIGIKKDKNGNPIHLKYKDIPAPSGGWPIPDADVPLFDTKGRPIPGSWQPVLIYSSEPIAMSGDTNNEPGIHNGMAFHTDADESIINANICLNVLANDNENRTNRYNEIVSINNNNGFKILSNSDNSPYRPPEIPPDPTEAPYSDDLSWSQLENLKDLYGGDEIATIEYIRYVPSEIDPTSNKNGMPSTSPTMIPNGNADQIVIPPGPYGPGGIIG